MQLDLAGFAVSAGAACSSGKLRPSHVLTAMGFGEDVARSAIRVSLGPATTDDEIDRFCAIWIALSRKRRRMAA
jgi:cysteine desulfurase